MKLIVFLISENSKLVVGVLAYVTVNISSILLANSMSVLTEARHALKQNVLKFTYIRGFQYFDYGQRSAVLTAPGSASSCMQRHRSTEPRL